METGRFRSHKKSTGCKNRWTEEWDRGGSSYSSFFFFLHPSALSKRGKAKDLFMYIARSVEHFVNQKSSTDTDEELLLGFTFSFVSDACIVSTNAITHWSDSLSPLPLQPVEQTAIDRGTLIKWTKGFDAPDALGVEVVGLLQSCLDELKVKVRINCLVNDTVGALLAHGYQSKGPALLGSIFGTGTNGAYVEEREKITKLEVEDPEVPRPATMIINAEWGGFDDERIVLPVTKHDNKVDRQALRPRHHAFEKMISGMYLGELTRIVFIHLLDSLVLFDGFSSDRLNAQYGFDTAYMSAILEDKADESDLNSATRKILVETVKIGKDHISEEDIRVVKRVCWVVGRRAARLSAVAVAAVIQHRLGSKVEAVNVGVDGSVVEFLPGFLDQLREALGDMLGSEVAKATKFGLAKDGSGVGAALCALQAKKQLGGQHHPHLKPHHHTASS
jgi:hexokinase